MMGGERVGGGIYIYIYTRESQMKNLKSAIKIRNTAQLSLS